MDGLLKQSTSITVLIGPFVDSTDGNTDETGLTLTQADIRLSFNGGNMAAKNDSTACTHDELGYYGCPLNSTDTGSLGILKLMVHKTGALPVFHSFQVVPSNVFDSIVSGSDYLDVSAVQIEGADATDAIEDACSVALTTYDALVAADISTLESNVASILDDTSVTIPAAISGLNNLSAGSVTDIVSTALVTYDGLVAADISTLETNVASILDDTSVTIPAAISGLNDVSASTITDLVSTAIATYDGLVAADISTLEANVATILDDTSVTIPGLVNGLNDPTPTNVVSALMAYATDGTLTFQTLIQAVFAGVAGKSTGGGTTSVAFRNYADDANRIEATVDSDGNRDAVTITGD